MQERARRVGFERARPVREHGLACGPDECVPVAFRLLEGTNQLLRARLKVGGENEYESDIEVDDKKNELKYYVTIGIDF